MTQAQHNQAFFERASSTKPKAAFRVNEYHNGGYELVSPKYVPVTDREWYPVFFPSNIF